MIIGIYLAGLLNAIPVSACPGRISTAVDVLAVHGPIETSTNFTLSQIRDFAQRSIEKPRHEPLGFYFAALGFAVFLDLHRPASNQCLDSIHITVKIALVDRHIEIGRELAQKQCRFTLVRDHYTRHAADDDAALTQFAADLGAALQGMSTSSLEGSAMSEQADRQKVQQEIVGRVDQELKRREAERAAALAAADTPEEVRKLFGACTADM